MVFLRYIVFVLWFVNPALASNSNQNYYRSFWNPTYIGQSLAYCTVDHKICGIGVANDYCKLMGYEQAAGQIIRHNVGLAHYLATKKQCKGWTCNGFKLIRCQSKIHHSSADTYLFTEKAFVCPRFNHYRVDWCYAGKRGCGKRAATSFCRRMGYMHAARYKKEVSVKATRAIGNQALCFGELCTAFSRIVCSR